MAQKSERITPRSEDFARWYQDVIRQADMAEPAEVVKGCMVIKPHGFAIWENIRDQLDRMFKATGHENAYFPLLIPESFLKREAEHVEGFSPELAVVTIGGGKKLEEPYVIRPTSETIIGHFFSKWIQSWRDLPLLINQWANVLRWEMRTRMFLRTSEFLWQEGHTAHASQEEAVEETMKMLGVYETFVRDWMAMPVVTGLKTDSERFAGALQSYCIEAMMQNGYALQAGTSHNLGQNFGKAFNVTFQNQQGEMEYVWQTSWGVSTRLIGGLIMTHSDDFGLVLPPKITPLHVVIIPIFKGDDTREALLAASHKLAEELQSANLRVKVDDREGYRPGNKFFTWEQKGIPIRVEIGPRDLEQGQIALKPRIFKDKEFVPLEKAVHRIGSMLAEIQTTLLTAAQKRLEDNSITMTDYSEFVQLMEPISAERGGGKFVWGTWCGDAGCEERVKSETKATIRCIPLKTMNKDLTGRSCMVCGGSARHEVVWAKAY